MIARFCADLAALVPDGSRLAIAVSGGPDSLGLLLLAQAAFPASIEAATVDHGLRAASGEEAQFVARVCKEIGVPHTILEVTVGAGNLQNEARRARYDALGDWMEARGLAHLATAHHADDQAETLLMRLNRGSGVAGLAGVRASGAMPGQEQLTVVRPVLGWRKAELEGVVRAAGFDPVRDPSNHDAEFDRVRIRQALAATEWLDVEAIASSAAHLADADAAIEWMAHREWETQVRQLADAFHYRPASPRAVRLRVLIRAIGSLGGTPRGGAVARLLDTLDAGSGGNVAGVMARCEDGEWVLRREPLRSAVNSAPPD